MALSDVELFLNAITHYLSGGTFLVNAFTKKRPTAFEHPNYKIITVGTQEDFERIPRDLLSAEQSLAPEDVDVLRYDGRPLAAVNPTCGYIEREAPESNSIWVPNTVAGSFKLTSRHQATLVAVIDLKTLEYIVLDVDAVSRVASLDLKTTLDLIRTYIEPPKVSVADLLRWHIEARGGTEVAEKENAKTVFNALDFTKDYVKILKTMFPNE